MADELTDIESLFEDTEDPITEGNPEDLQEGFDNLPSVTSPTDQQSTTETSQQPRSRAQTDERNPLKMLPNALRPTIYKEGFDAATGLVNGKSDDVFRELNANIVDWADNTFLGDKRTKDEILETRDKLSGQGILNRMAMSEKASAGPTAVSETIGIPIGAGLGNLESVFELGELVGDTLKWGALKIAGQEVDPTQIPFGSKYEWAQWNLGRSHFGAKSGPGQVAQGFLQFAGLLRATGGLKGLADGKAKVLQRFWRTATPGQKVGLVTKGGMVGGLYGIPADVITTITDPDQSNLSNLIKEHAPEWYPEWATALAVDDDDSMAEAILKTSFEGFGLGYVADAAGVVIVGNKVFKRLLGEGVDKEQATIRAVRETVEEQKLLEPYNQAGRRPTEDLEVSLPIADFNQYEFWRLGSNTSDTNLFGELGEVVETIRSYSPQEQQRWWQQLGKQSKDGIFHHLSLETQWRIKGTGIAKRPIQLPNGTVLEFNFHKGENSISPRLSSPEVSISWNVKGVGTAGRNIKKGVEPLSEYTKEWKKWQEKVLANESTSPIGNRPEPPDEEVIGRWGRSVIREIQKIAREELVPGTVVTNTPISDGSGRFGMSGAQSRRGEAWSKKLPKEAEGIFLEKFQGDDSSGWKAVTESIIRNSDERSNANFQPLDADDAFDLIKRINKRPNAKNAWEALTTEQKRNIARRYTDAELLPEGWDAGEPNIREGVYKTAGFGSTNNYGAQVAVVRSAPDGRGRWLTPVNDVLDERGFVDSYATDQNLYNIWRANINPIKLANDFIFNTSTGVGVAEDRINRYLKLLTQQERGIPITWDDVKTVFPEYFVTGSRQPITELPEIIAKELEQMKLGEFDDFNVARDLDGNIVTDGFLVDIDGVSLNKFDEQSINDFLTKNSQLLTRDDVVVYYSVAESRPLLKLTRLVAADDEAQALGMLFDQPQILSATGWTRSGDRAGTQFRITNYAQVLANPDIRKAFREQYIENYRQSDWDQYMENAPPGEYEQIFDRFVGDSLLNLRDFMSDPPPGIEFTGGRATEGVDFDTIDTYGIDQLKTTKGNHLDSIFSNPHERRTVTPTEAAAQQLQEVTTPNVGTRSGSQRTLTNAQIRLLADGAPDGVEDQIRTLVRDTPINIRELSQLTQLSEGEILENATKSLADIFDQHTGKVDLSKLDVSEYGATGDVLLTRTGIVQTRMLMQEMSKGLWEASYNIVKLGDAGEDSFAQVELMVSQWKALARTYKISANAHSNLLHASAIKLPWGGEVPNPIPKVDLNKVDTKLKEGEKVLDDLVEKLKSGDNEAKRAAMKIANTLLLSDGDISITNKLWQYIGEISSGQALKIMYNSLLSGPATHLVNATSNMINTVYRPIAAATGGNVRQKKMAAAGFYGIQQTLKDSFKMAEMVYKNGGKAINDGGKGIVMDSELNAKLDLLHKAAKASDDDGFKRGVGFVDITHGVANFPLFSWPSNLLVTADEFFKTMTARMEYNSQMMSIAIDEAGNGKNIDDVFQKLLKDNLDTNFDKATGAILNEDLLKVAKETTFQTELSGPAGKFAHFINEAPALRVFFPFVKTGHNIMVYAGEHVPLLNRQLSEYKAVMAGDDEYAKAVMKGRESIGRYMVVGAGLAAWNGLITGNGPMDPEQRKLWLKTHQPRSIKVGNTWIKYDRIEPFGQILAPCADIVYAMQTGQLSENRAEYLTGYLTYSIASNLTQKSFFQGLVPLGKLLTPGWQGMSSLARVPLDTVNNFIPLASARRTFTNLHTPYYQEFNNVFDKFVNQVTWGAVKGDDQYDWLNGEKIGNDRGLLNSILPLQINTRGSSIVHDKLEDIEFDSSGIVKELGGIELNKKQKARLAQLMGTSGLYHELEKWVTHPDFDQAVEDFKTKLRQGQPVTKQNEYFYKQITRIIAKYRDAALEQVKNEFPELRDKVNERELYRYNQKTGNNAVQELANF